MSQADLLSLPIEKYNFWRDLFASAQRCRRRAQDFRRSVLLRRHEDRSLPAAANGSGIWNRCARNWPTLKKALPPQYPFLQAIKDDKAPRDMRVAIRGDTTIAAKWRRAHLPSILCEGAPKPFAKGSGRLELAEAIADPANPLTARVMVNRIWQHHFGRGIVRTPSNFGNWATGPRIRNCSTIWRRGSWRTSGRSRRLHREIMLSAVYRPESEDIPANNAVDPDNRLLWRANWQRLDVESLRDSLLFVAGNLDLKAGGPPAALDGQEQAAHRLRFRQPPQAGSHAGAVRFSQSEQHQRAAHGDQRSAAAAVLHEQQPCGRAGSRSLAKRLSGTEIRARIRRRTGLSSAGSRSAEELRTGPGSL